MSPLDRTKQISTSLRQLPGSPHRYTLLPTARSEATPLRCEKYSRVGSVHRGSVKCNTCRVFVHSLPRVLCTALLSVGCAAAGERTSLTYLVPALWCAPLLTPSPSRYRQINIDIHGNMALKRSTSIQYAARYVRPNCIRQATDQYGSGFRGYVHVN